MYKQVTIPTTISDLVDSRNQAIQRLKEAYHSIDKAKDELDAIKPYLMPYEARIKISLSVAIKEIDIRMWRHAFDKAGFFKVMDQQAKDEFEKSLEKNPPEFCIDNIRSTFVSLAAEADYIFERGIVNLFKKLSGKYKTNDAFKVGKKVIVTRFVRSAWGCLEIHCDASASINDLDRVIKRLDGKEHNPRALEMAINGAWKRGDGIYEDEYYKIRGFLNGNIHITFNKLGLIDKVNDIIHEFYNGNSIPKG